MVMQTGKLLRAIPVAKIFKLGILNFEISAQKITAKLALTAARLYRGHLDRHWPSTETLFKTEMLMILFAYFLSILRDFIQINMSFLSLGL